MGCPARAHCRSSRPARARPQGRAARGLSPMAREQRGSRTFHHDLVGVFRAYCQVRIALVGAELAQSRREIRIHLVRAQDRKLALRGSADELDRALLGEAEIDEEFAIE